MQHKKKRLFVIYGDICFVSFYLVGGFRSFLVGF